LWIENSFYFIARFCPFLPRPFPPTPGCHPLISARFLCLTEKRRVEMRGKKGTNTGNKIKTIFNSQLTRINMKRKIWKWRLLLSLRCSSFQSFSRMKNRGSVLVSPLVNLSWESPRDPVTLRFRHIWHAWKEIYSNIILSPLNFHSCLIYWGSLQAPLGTLWRDAFNVSSFTQSCKDLGWHFRWERRCSNT
jgi:hypothetical protein